MLSALRLLVVLTAVSSLSPSFFAEAFWRLPCGNTLLTQRSDPIVFPAATGPKGHVHSIFGGSAFETVTDTEKLLASQCTTCTVTQDKSLYWVPTLYFRQANGTLVPVPQMGALIYYLQRYNNATEQANLLAFPDGLRMIAGDNTLRNYTDTLQQRAVNFVCLDFNAPASAQTNRMQGRNCPSLMRAEINFPSCWDGVNLDSSDHKSHVAYPSGVDSGACPGGFPKRLIEIFYETFWDINQFSDRWVGSQHPWMWSMGDTKGYGFHADFINGWNHSVLQNAVSNCNDPNGIIENCPYFNLQQGSQMSACQPEIPSSVYSEQVNGTLSSIPGNFTMYHQPYNEIDFSTSDGPLDDDVVLASRYDLDGSLTGQAFTTILPPMLEYFNGPGCILNTTLNGRVCPQVYTPGSVHCHDQSACAGPKDVVNNLVQVRRTSDSNDFQPYVNELSTPGWGAVTWNTLWAVNTSYLAWFSSYTPTTFSLQISQGAIADWFEIAICMPFNTTISSVSRGKGYAFTSLTIALQATTDMMQFHSATTTTQGGFYLYDQVRSILHIRLLQRQKRLSDAQFSSDNIGYCPAEGCEFIIVTASHNNTGTNCSASAFDTTTSSPYGSLQVHSTDPAPISAWFSGATVAQPRADGPTLSGCGASCISINVGDVAGVYTDDLGNAWSPDEYFTGGSLTTASSNIGGDLAFGGEVYETARSGNFVYNIPVASAGWYQVQLLFVELFFKNTGQRVFDVILQSNIVLSSLDLVAIVGPNNPYQVSFNVQVLSKSITGNDPVITLTTNGLVNSGILSGIQISPIIDTADLPNLNCDGCLYINAGSSASATPFVPFTDLAGATWTADMNFTGGSTSSFGNSLLGSTTFGGSVFLTYRNGNSQYSIPVSEPGTYNVSLLFVESYWTKVGGRVFNVMVQNQLAISNLDVFALSGGRYVPYVTSVLATVNSSSLFVNIAFVTITDQAMISGIAIVPNDFKIVVPSSSPSPVIAKVSATPSPMYKSSSPTYSDTYPSITPSAYSESPSGLPASPASSPGAVSSAAPSAVPLGASPSPSNKKSDALQSCKWEMSMIVMLSGLALSLMI